ncbi:hypothetical protein BHE74_00010303 [Ensete ventricosum]|nr:hypothetical protein BHE74_00010303 [Ensete ventricosum]
MILLVLPLEPGAEQLLPIPRTRFKIKGVGSYGRGEVLSIGRRPSWVQGSTRNHPSKEDLKPLARILPSSRSSKEEIGLHPRKGHQAIPIAPLTSLPTGQLSLVAIELTLVHTSALPMGAEVP